MGSDVCALDEDSASGVVPEPRETQNRPPILGGVTATPPVRVGVVGSGWRTQNFVRVAAPASAQLQVAGIVTRTAERGAEVAEQWSVPTYRSVSELAAAERPDYIAAAVPWGQMPAVVEECVGLGLHVLAETPPAPTVDGLRALWAAVGGSELVQVAEQYLLMPGHAARLTLARQGLVGDITSVQVSSTHGYHATSMIRGLLGVGFAPATVTAQAFRTPLANPLGQTGWTGDATPQELTTTIATLDFGDGRMGLYDFTDNQWFNPLRSRRIVIRGTLGEIVDDTAVRIVDPTTVLDSQIVRRVTGKDMDLQGFDLDHVSHEGQVLWRNPYFGARLSEDDLGIAEILYRTGLYARGEGPAVYSLADGCQDHLLSLAIDEAVQTAQPVTVAREAWA
jgi:predicted dehydrogenase